MDLLGGDTDSSGAGSTQQECYSGDGPDHWVTVNGVGSNHVTWTWSAPAPRTSAAVSTPPVSTQSPTTPPTATPVTSTSPATFQEQQGHHGANTFLNYHNASGVGPRVDPAAWIQVSCKVYDPTIQSVSPDGYWYRIASAPWNDSYYVAANTFMNGDPWDGPYTHNTDFAVPAC